MANRNGNRHVSPWYYGWHQNPTSYCKKQVRIARKILWAFIAILAVLIVVVH